MRNEYDIEDGMKPEFDSFWVDLGLDQEIRPGILDLEMTDNPAFAAVKVRRQSWKKQGIADQFYEMQIAR